MKIYAITALGHRVARSIRQDETGEWKVLNYLDKRGSSTLDQIKADVPNAGSAIHKLIRSGLIAEVGGQ